jgi:hypothetical protein
VPTDTVSQQDDAISKRAKFQNDAGGVCVVTKKILGPTFMVEWVLLPNSRLGYGRNDKGIHRTTNK